MHYLKKKSNSMKKIIMLAAFVAMTTAAMAWGTQVPGNGQTLEQTYYGTKASNSPENPCKGATTRVCGKVVVTNNNGMISQITYRPKGWVIYYDEKPKSEWVKEHVNEGNAGVAAGSLKPFVWEDSDTDNNSDIFDGNGGDN